MNKSIVYVVCCLLGFYNVKAQDPNFHIYLCFGQSNMEGQGTIENQDRTVNSRFQILQAVNCSGQPAQQWRTATPPLCRCSNGIGPADYFGRTMVENLPSTIQVGIVHVSVAGCKIELFDKANYANYANGAEQWMKNIIAEYGGNPYARLVELAKIAQQKGVIKGILLHQGESNSGDQQWPNKVNGVYKNLLNDLGLTASEVPLLAGQVVDAAQGGLTAGMNTIINTLPNTIPTAHVISASGCTDQSDNLHFNTAGYRLLGTRYAETMLELLDLNTEIPPSIVTDLTDVLALENEELTITIQAGGSELNYQWYENGIPLNNATDKTLIIPLVTSSYEGNTYKVVISNSYGTVESNTITLTVTDFLGVKIYKTFQPIIIDGLVDEVWNHTAVMPIIAEKPLVGTLFSSDDLSGTAKFLWDNDYLYLLANVIDDVKINDSQNTYEDDNVEFYFDIDNDKATTYGANDVQYSFAWNDGTSVGTLPTGRSTTGINYVVTEKSNGYTVEARIPWTTLQATPSINQTIGLDFMINDDDDGTGRDAKLSWNASEDQAWQNPSFFGTAKLLEVELVTSTDEITGNQFSIYPNPFSDKLSVNTKGSFELIAMDAQGREVMNSSCVDGCTFGEDWQEGIYLVKIITAAEVASLKVLKQ